MSSGFVPAGADATSTKPDDAWVKAEQLVAQSRSAETRPTKQDDGKSLYDVLQQNKGGQKSFRSTKQEAFEEAARLKNQFRSLDDDEVDFLDSVLESTRAKEAEVRKETAEQLEVFRRQREAAEKAQFEEDNTPASAGGVATSPSTAETWLAKPKKRRRDKDSVLVLGAKLRKTSSAGSDSSEVLAHRDAANTQPTSSSPGATTAHTAQSGTAMEKQPAGSAHKASTAPAATLGLGDYSSDDD